MKLKYIVKKEDKESFKCMNEQCNHTWTGGSKPQGNCKKCDSQHYEWVNFRDDWIEDEEDNWKWKRK